MREVIKKTYKNSRIFRFFIRIAYSLLSLARVVHVFIKSIFNIKGIQDIRIAHIGPIHSSHYRSASSFLSNILNLRERKEHKLLIQSNPTVYYPYLEGSFEIIDRGIYNLLGSVHKNWLETLMLDAKTGFNRLTLVFLRKILRLFNPDIIWVHDVQSAGYLYLDIFSADYMQDTKPYVILSVWGNDIKYFYNRESHQEKIKSFLSHADFIITETHQEIDILRSLGYSGLCSIPQSVTFKERNSHRENSTVYSPREYYIVIKSSPFRSNMNWLVDQINADKQHWKGRRIALFNPTPEDVFSLKRVEDIVNIDIFEALTKNELYNLFLKSSFHLICNYSDGLVNTAFEAADASCIPLFSKYTGTGEFLTEQVRNMIVYDFHRPNITNTLISIEADRRLQKIILDDVNRIATETGNNDLFLQNITALLQAYERFGKDKQTPKHDRRY